MVSRRRLLVGVSGLSLATAGCLDGGESRSTEGRDDTTGTASPRPVTTTDPTATRTPTVTESTPNSRTPTVTPTSPTPTVTASPTPEPTTAATVRIDGGSFEPRRLSVAPNTLVRWVNDDVDPHRIESMRVGEATTSWDFSSAGFGRGERVQRVFRDPGTYAYFSPTWGRSTSCGLVAVGDAAFDGDLPCESGY